MLKKGWLILPVLLVFLLSSQVFAYDFFMYDLEQSKIMYMSNTDTGFNKIAGMEKCPDFIVKTEDPDKFLAVFTPQKAKSSKEESLSGRLILFNTATSRTEDLVDIGYYPFRWTHTKNFKHFFISYAKKPGDTYSQLLHYDMTTKKSEILEEISGTVKDLELATDETRLYVSAAADKDQSQLLTISYAPLKIENTLPTEKSPGSIYFVAPDTMALVSYNWVDEYSGKGGSISLLDMKNNQPIQKMEFKKKGAIYTRWHDKERVLIIIDGSRKPDIYKVSAAGIAKFTAKGIWLDFKYLPELDRLLVLENASMEEFDFATSQQIKGSTETPNIATSYWGTQSPYRLYPIEGTDIVALYSRDSDKCKFYNLKEHKVTVVSYFGRTGKKIWSTNIPHTNLAVNQDKSRIYILCVSSKDITVFDNQFAKLHFIIPEDPPLRIFQVKKPVFQTLVATTKGLAKISSDSQTIEPVARFEQTALGAACYEDENKFLVWTDKEFLVLKKDTFEVTAHYSFYSEPLEKSKKDPKRHYKFIYNLNME
jgi:hypothetical protein